MRHIPVVSTNAFDKQIEFSHIQESATRNTWNRESIISLANCKINIFLKGSFSVVVENTVYSPMYGDICFLVPFEQHFGQIDFNTELDYFQLDIGIRAFEDIPCGIHMFDFLTNRQINKSPFIRPSLSSAKKIIDLCYEIEKTISINNMALAYAYIVIFISMLNTVYGNSDYVDSVVLSKYVLKTVQYVEKHYNEKITTKQLSDICGISTSFLARTFKKEIGMSIHEYIIRHRLLQSISMLKENDITSVGIMCGFADCSHYICQFKKYFGCTPYEYKKHFMHLE